MKITAKLAAIFAILSTASIIAVGYVAYQTDRESILLDKYNDLYSANDYTLAAFESWIDERAKSIELMAKLPFFQDQLPGIMESHDIHDPVHTGEHRKMVETRLAPIVNTGSFLEVFLIRPGDGLLAFSTDRSQVEKRVAGQLFFIHGKQRTYIQTVYYSMALQRAAMTISTPITDKAGKPIAVLAGHLNLADLSAIMKKGRHLRRTLDTYFVNKFNFFVTEPRFGQGYALKRAVQTKGVNAALSGKTGIALYTDYRDEPVIGAYRWLPRWEMGIISEIDQTEAFEPISRLQINVAVLSGIVIAAAAFAGWLIALNITRPLKRLVAETEKVGKGDLELNLPTTARDEIGTLSRAFYRMTVSLGETLVSRDALAKEVSERQKVETELKESEAKFRILSETAPVGIFIIDRSTLKLAYANPTLCRIFGYAQSDLLGKRGPMELTHPEDHAETERHLDRVIAGENPEVLTFKGLHRDGIDLVCEVIVRTAEIDGTPMFVGTLVDATERIEAKESIRREKEFNNSIINSLPGVFYMFDEQNLRFHRWNQNFEDVTGYASSEIAGMSPLELFDEQDGARVAERIGDVFQFGYSNVEADFLTKTRDRIPYFLTGKTVIINDINYLVGMGIDITERKRTEKALQESENRFRRIAESARDMIYRMSLPDGIYEYVSPASTEVFGYPPEVFYDRPFLIREAIHKDWRAYFEEQWNNLLNGTMPPTYEYQIVDPTGQVRWLNQRNVLVRNDEGSPVAIEGIVTDVTASKRATIEQIRLEKFVVLGQLSAGVAHELNNPLMGILNYAQYCLEGTPPDDVRHPVLSDIELETKRCIGIVQNLLGASRLEDLKNGKIELISTGDILNRVVRLMEYRTGKENVNITIDVDDDLPEIYMSSESFQQLCLNLFTNAVDAVESIEAKEIDLRIGKNNGDIIFTVSDNGVGIPDDIQNKIFDPFYTTKAPGKGTGLGLTTCWNIVHQQGGTIEYQRQPHAGTTVTVRLPAHSKEDT